MREGADAHRKRRRRSTQTLAAARRLVVSELVSRGFEARVVDHASAAYVLAGRPGSRVVRVHVKAVYLPPWYFRSAGVEQTNGADVTAFVLLEPQGNARSARFFIVKNRDLTRRFRAQASSMGLRSIDLTELKQYEDNWALLKE